MNACPIHLQTPDPGGPDDRTLHELPNPDNSLASYTGAADLEWRVSNGLGTVHATTVVHPQQGAVYNVCLVDVDEGFRMMTRVEDIEPSAVKIGMRVRFRVHTPGGDDDPYPVFTPVQGV